MSAPDPPTDDAERWTIVKALLPTLLRQERRPAMVELGDMQAMLTRIVEQVREDDPVVRAKLRGP